VFLGSGPKVERKMGDASVPVPLRLLKAAPFLLAAIALFYLMTLLAGS
jgi:hypothetical protein